MIRKTSKLAVTLLMCVICVLAIGASAFAAETVTAPDYDRTGSVSVTIKAYGEDGNVAGGQLELYQIAELRENEDQSFNFVYVNSSYANTGIALNTDMTASDADTFYEVIKANNITPTATAQCSETTIFNDIELGVYLIAQNGSADGYESINPFVVTVPMHENGEYIYNIDASPKTEPVNSIPSDEPPTVSEPANSEPVVSNNGGSNGNDGDGGDIQTGDPFTDIMRYALCAGVLAGAAIAVNAIYEKRKGGAENE